MASQSGHDIFISYAREDEQRVRPLVSALEAEGWRVFWDRNIPIGETWLDYIGARLEAAPTVIVAWSRHSVRSEFVYSEASRARARRALLPVLIDHVSPPLGLDGVHGADLVPWLDAGAKGPLPSVLIDAIGRFISAPDAAPPATGQPHVAQAAQRRAGRNVRNFVIAGAALAAIVAAGTVFVPQLVHMTTEPTKKTASAAVVPSAAQPAPTVAPGTALPLPFPTVDFVLESRIVGSSGGFVPGSLTVLRHKEGKLRIDIEAPGSKTYWLAAREADIATLVLVQPPDTIWAMDVDLTKFMPSGAPIATIWWRATGTPVGTDRIMNEACEWWQTVAGEPYRTCFTPDGIPLKIEKVTSGETFWQGMRLERSIQDPAQFVIPANAQRMNAPTMQRQ